MAPKTKVDLHPKLHQNQSSVGRNPAAPLPLAARTPTNNTSVRNSFAPLAAVPSHLRQPSAAIPVVAEQEDDRKTDSEEESEEDDGENDGSDGSYESSDAEGENAGENEGNDGDDGTAQSGSDDCDESDCDDCDAESESECDAEEENDVVVQPADDGNSGGSDVVHSPVAGPSCAAEIAAAKSALRRSVSEPSLDAGFAARTDAILGDSQEENGVVQSDAELVAAVQTDMEHDAAVQTDAEHVAAVDDSSIDDGGKLDYVPVSVEDGKLMIAPCDDDISRCKKNWHECLVGYFVGSTLPDNVVKESARRMWGKKGLVDTFVKGRGFYFFRFDSENARKRVLETGPHFMLKHNIVLQQYEKKMRLVKERQKQIAIWVKLFNIPVELLSYRGLSLVASAVGRPLYLDEATKKMVTNSVDRFTFARVCVMADAERALPNEMFVDYGDGDEHIKIEAKYEWRPPHCAKCKVFGHSCNKRTVEKIVAASYADAVATSPIAQANMPEWPDLAASRPQHKQQQTPPQAGKFQQPVGAATAATSSATPQQSVAQSSGQQHKSPTPPQSSVQKQNGPQQPAARPEASQLPVARPEMPPSQRPQGKQQRSIVIHGPQASQRVTDSQRTQQPDGFAMSQQEIDEEGWQKAKGKGRGRGRGKENAPQKQGPRTRSRFRTQGV